MRPTLLSDFENALYNIARSWRQAVDRRLKYLGISMAGWMAIAAHRNVRSPLSQSSCRTCSRCRARPWCT